LLIYKGAKGKIIKGKAKGPFAQIGLGKGRNTVAHRRRATSIKIPRSSLPSAKRIGI
jgi:hypothetical protein